MPYTYGTFTRTFSDGAVAIDTAPASYVSFTQSSRPGDFKSPTPYSYTLERIRYPHGSIQSAYGYVDEGELFYSSALDVSAHNVFNIEQITNESEDKALEKLIKIMRNRDVSGHDMLVSLFESPELKSLFEQLSDIIKHIRKNKLLKVIKGAGPAVAASEFYLLWTFGISPLITAINEILATLDTGFIEHERNFKVTGVAKEVIEKEMEGDPYYGPYTTLASYSVRTSLTGALQVVDVERLILSQFGLTTPVASYWAVLPLSFVLDWFINVGSYLDTCEYLLGNTGVKVRGLYKSQTRMLQNINTRSGLYGHYKSNVQCIYRRVEFDRTLLAEVPFPHVPVFKPRLNGGKITSLAALAIQILHS